ncbi:MAG: GH92 family glycosyl hydrolase [Myxococcales bacterium]|nr:GH92 family glycosyl hydrolase [Myxococcales bacterium]MDH3483761.1 GH92 family glycosyl hydrolase [Myxococcales bacterium]
MKNPTAVGLNPSPLPACLALFACLALPACTGSTNTDRNLPAPPADAPLAVLVDPFIGTAGDGMTFPGAIVPWGMASPSPHTVLTTAADALEGLFVNGGYRYGEPKIHGFGLTHLSGVGCPDLGLPVVAPTTGDVPLSFDDYGASYRNEVAWAGYYGVELGSETDGDSTIRAGLTATPRTGVLRFEFPSGEPANITLDAARGISWRRNDAQIDAVSETEIVGSAGFGGFCAQQGGGRIYFVARVDRAADAFGVVVSGTRSPAVQASGDAMAFLRYDVAPTSPVTLWVGLSWVSTDAARANLDAEQLPFDQARDGAALAWQDRLGRIEVTGGFEDDRVRFYTALYHALIHPSIAHDVDGTYPRFSRDEVGNAGGASRFTVFSLWDTYRTVHPLLTLVYPEMQLAILRSLQDMTLGADAPPKWELIGDEVQMMVGDPANIVVADSFAKGLTDFDAEGLYDVMKNAADRATHRPGNDTYLELGYVPMERSREVWGPVSTTLEYGLADWSLAQLAGALDRNADVAALEARAASYRTLFDADTGTLRPKNVDGTFLDPFDPDAFEDQGSIRLGGPGYVEGTAWQYAFFVPHDVPGLIALHGEQAFVDRLRWVFDTDRFVMWNEPDMHYPYLFTFVEGAASNTQREVRRAINRYFGAGPDGLPGNDDAGALSAWFVFSAMGFYPVTPGLAEYRLGSPLFERVLIHLTAAHHAGESFVIEAVGNDAESVFVRSATLNGEALTTPVLSHGAVTAGGVLTLEMSGG